MGKIPTYKLIYSFLSFGVLWGLATACAPRNDEKARVSVVGPGKAEKNLVECRKSFNDKQIQQVEGFGSEICMVSPGGSNQSYSIVAKEVKFEALREGTKILLGITAGVRVSGEQANQEQTSEVIETLKSSCLTYVTNTFAKGGNYGLHLTLKAAHDQTTEKDQEMTMIPSTKNPGSYALSIWPDQPELVVRANQHCQDKCKDYDGVQASSCQKTCLSEVNYPFCRNFAKLVGHWVGLHEPSEGSRCERKNKRASEEATATETASKTGTPKAVAKKSVSLMSGFKEPNETSADVSQKTAATYLSGEGLSREEQAKIMDSLCPTLRADANKAGNNNLGKVTGKNKGKTLEPPKVVQQQPIGQGPGAVTPAPSTAGSTAGSTQTGNTNTKAADTKKK